MWLPGPENQSKLPLRPAHMTHRVRQWWQEVGTRNTDWVRNSSCFPEAACSSKGHWFTVVNRFYFFFAYEKLTLKFKPSKKTPCKVTLDHRRNLMTNKHAHCNIDFQESKFHTMDSKINFSTVLHYSNNAPLLGTNMKRSHMLWNIKKIFEQPQKTKP